MISRDNSTTILNSEQIQFYGVQDGIIKGFIKQCRHDISEFVAVVFCRLVVSKLQLLQHMKITFQARSLGRYVLSVGVNSA
jgi:hypothetical protein